MDVFGKDVEPSEEASKEATYQVVAPLTVVVSDASIEFWGVEVKYGESLKINPRDDKLVHLSVVCLGNVCKDKRSEPVSLYVKIDDQKLVLGTFSSGKFPHISYETIFEKKFELSRN